jgi:hypothetical protein
LKRSSRISCFLRLVYFPKTFNIPSTTSIRVWMMLQNRWFPSSSADSNRWFNISILWLSWRIWVQARRSFSILNQYNFFLYHQMNRIWPSEGSMVYLCPFYFLQLV